MKFKLFTKRTLLGVSNQVLINLTSGWFGVVLISPGLLGVPSQQYFELLIKNLPIGILSLVVSAFVAERIKKR